MLHAAALYYFREVARVGSIRRAASSMNVAASALNRQIINLEIQLGTPLFDRLPGGMRLTVAGDLLLRHVREMVDRRAAFALARRPVGAVQRVACLLQLAGGETRDLGIGLRAGVRDVRLRKGRIAGRHRAAACERCDNQ